MEQRKKWIITLSGDRPLDEVKQHLSGAGFSIEQVLDQIGSITGSAADHVAEQLRKTPGIADVSPDMDVDIGPPDKPIT